MRRTVAQRFEVAQCETMAALGARIPAQPVQGVRLGQIDWLQDVGVENGEAGTEDPKTDAYCGRHAHSEQR